MASISPRRRSRPVAPGRSWSRGYTDVMAAQLSGVEGAVATCGTAFGVDHFKLLRRLMRDEPGLEPARIIFTFDGDAAGRRRR